MSGKPSLKAEHLQHCPSRTRQMPVSFLASLRLVWLDYLWMIVLASLTIVVWESPIFHFDNRIVLLSPFTWKTSGYVAVADLQTPMELSYPWMPEPIPSWACGILVVCVPLFVIGLFQLGSRNFWEFHAGALGIMKALVATVFVCTVLKQSVGGFRPHFVEVCKPDLSPALKNMGQERYWFNATACTGALYDVKKAMQSFPSGHTANSFAASSFMSLFLNAKLKVISNRASPFWAFAATFAPLLCASIIGGLMYLSYQHHASDILFGIVIGLSFGLLSYCSTYAAVFDFRYNHIPLESTDIM